MADHDDHPSDDHPIDDADLAARFDRLVELADAPVPSIDDLEGRIVALAERRRRAQRRTALLAVAAAIAAVGLLAVLLRPSPASDELELVTDPTATSLPVDEQAEPVFTIGAVPEGLAFRACDPLSDVGQTVTGVTCTFDDPTTGPVDGLRVTRIIEGATAEVRAAWEAGDAAAAAVASGGGDDPAAATFRTLGGVQVLDLAPGGGPSSDGAAALQVLVGDDLVDLGASSVSLAELEQVIAGLGTTAPSVVVSEALAALPDGSSALVQGPRPLWVQVEPLRPQDRIPFGGQTVGAELQVPGSTRAVGVDVTTGIDAAALLRSLADAGDPSLTEAELGGRPAVLLAPGGMMPLTVPEPRAGPQAFVQLDDDAVVRVRDPGGSAPTVSAIAAAFD